VSADTVVTWIRYQVLLSMPIMLHVGTMGMLCIASSHALKQIWSVDGVSSTSVSHRVHS